MSKNKTKDGIVVNAGNGNYIPNIVRGGAAIPIGKKNFYYMQGRKHEQGGIDVGRNAKTGLEVEGEEVMKVSPKEVRVYSSVPFLQGNSPAELVMGGANPDAVLMLKKNLKIEIVLTMMVLNIKLAEKNKIDKLVILLMMTLHLL